MEARLIEPDAPEWREVLDAVRHDIYHLPAYVRASAGPDRGRATALLISDVAGRRLLLPLVVRETQGGHLDATSPYGYAGPLATGEIDKGFVEEAMADGIDHLRQQGLISLFVRLHPLLPVPGLESCGRVVTHGPGVVIDLSMSEDELWRQTRKNHRRDIAKSIDAGNVFSFSDQPDDFAAFRHLYLETMHRNVAAEYYHFDDAYFDRLRAALGPDLHLATVSVGDEIAAAGLFTTSCGIVQLHLAGWKAVPNVPSPTKLMYHRVREWARARGERWFHLGGGRGAMEDSLLHFKSGFSPERRPIQTLRVVMDWERYRRLTDRAGIDDHVESLDGFFPAYRREETIGQG